MSSNGGVLALAIFLGPFAQAGAVLGDDPLKFDQLLDSAILRRDAAFIEAAVAGDARFSDGVEPGELVWDKQAFVNAVKIYNGLARNVDSVQVERHGDLIETLGHIQVRMPYPAGAEYEVYFVRLYRRGPDGWQFVSHRTVRETDGPISDLLPRPPAAARTNSLVGTEEGPVRPGNGVAWPRLTKAVKPNYTSEGLRAKIQGAVLAECRSS